MMHLDLLSPTEVTVGYGQLGLGGSLGYEGKRVVVGGTTYPRALSTHPPARVSFDLGGRFTIFRSRIALTDDVPVGVTHANFRVLVDGRVVASRRVDAGDRPLAIEADVRDGQRLELVVDTRRWAYCHAVWLDPTLDGADSRMPTSDRDDASAAAYEYVDALPLRSASVGFGTLGRHGALGYEDKQVMVLGQPYRRALSAHAPARLAFELGGRFTRFHCKVALNDDVPARASYAHFMVRADGRLVASAPYVVAGDRPVELSADITGAEMLELITTTSRWVYAHAVWLDPKVDGRAARPPEPTLPDCLDRVEMTVPAELPRARRCLATAVSPGFAAHLDDLLGSISANGGCQDALIAVFAVDADDACLRVAAKYGATIIHCRHRANVNATVKSVLYSAARVIDAEQFICLDADMLVVGDLNPLFAMIDACPGGSILACREANGPYYNDIMHALCSVYGGKVSDVARIIGADHQEGSYPLVVNDGTFAGSRTALLALDGALRRWTGAPKWVDERRDVWWRNQLVFNLALAHLNCGVELDESYNIQLNNQEATLSIEDGRLQAHWHGRPARVLHFNGLGRHKYPEWRGRYARVEHPIGPGHGDGYAAFLIALRAWVGLHGLTALAWSFYGNADATSARVRDPATFPLLALLHYLIRSNGCVRVLETGTARGVSAACLASAVAHRANARVVSFDPFEHPGRDELWAALPEPMRGCIEQRAVDSIEGMSAAIEAGERYDAALLDSIHLEEHVWAEFQLATQLVCPGGLILIHDPNLPTGTVGRAIERIEDAGYGVARLWTAEGGEPEDDHLGLAVIENRRRVRHDRAAPT